MYFPMFCDIDSQFRSLTEIAHPYFGTVHWMRFYCRWGCGDAGKEGFDSVEAYPQKDASVKWMQFMGFDGLYKSEENLPEFFGQI